MQSCGRYFDLYSIYIAKSNRYITHTYYILVEWWFFEFIADDEIKENEQEQGAVEDRLADNLTEIDSDCPEITNCSGKFSPIFIVICTFYIMLKDYDGEVYLLILKFQNCRI